MTQETQEQAISTTPPAAPATRTEAKTKQAIDDGDQREEAQQSRQRYTKWLEDRVKGESKYDPDNKPPHRMFYVPKAILRRPNVLEMNRVMEFVGKIGVIDPMNHKARRFLIRIGLLSNILGIFLLIFSFFAVTDNFGLLKTASFSIGSLRNGLNLTSQERIPDADAWLGLKNIAVDVPSIGFTNVISFDNTCDQNVAFSNFLDPNQCSECSKNSGKIISSLIFSLIFHIPILVPDTLRQYANYDVNCQKAFCVFFSLLSIILTIHTMLKYRNGCFESVLNGDIYFAADGSVSSSMDNDAELMATLSYRAGAGLWTLRVATILKAIDLICNIAVPTPSITRDQEEQKQYERLYYGDTGEADVEQGATEEKFDEEAGAA